jgi:drug/metabolite transporter (DMT)-like permease
MLIKNNNIKAILIMLISALGFSCKNATGKALAIANLTPIQVVFFSSVIPVIATSIILFKAKKQTRKLNNPFLQIIRGLIITATQFCAYLALSKVALANVTVIMFSSSLFASSLAFIFLKERISKQHIIAIIIGFIGTFIIVNPNSQIFSLYSLVALTASFLYGITIVLGRYIQKADGLNITIFFYFFIPFITTLIPALSDKNLLSLSTVDISLIALLSLSCYIGLFAITLAIKLAPVAVVTPINYSQLIFAGLIGYIFFNENINLELIAGAVLIIGSGIYITMLQKKSP